MGNGGKQLHRGIAGFHMRRSKLRPPYRHMHLFCSHQPHVPVKPCPRIPARRLRAVFQTYCQRILPPVRIDIMCHVDVERIIPQRPEARFFSVHVNPRFTHGTIEHQGSLFARRHFEGGAIPACAYVGKSSGASGLHRSLRLEVLLNRHVLQVMAPVERTIDSPVMRHGHGFPLRIVKRLLHSLRRITFREFPVLL